MSTKDTHFHNTQTDYTLQNYCTNKDPSTPQMEIDDNADNEDNGVNDYKETDSVLSKSPTTYNNFSKNRPVIKPNPNPTSPQNIQQQKHNEKLHNTNNQQYKPSLVNTSLAQINAKINKALEIYETAPSKHAEIQLTNAIIQKRDKIYEIYQNNSQYNQLKFDITRRGNFYTQSLKHANIHSHINPLHDYIRRQNSIKTNANPNGIRKPPKITFQCDSFAKKAFDSHAMSDILSDLTSQDVTGNLYNIIAGEFDLEHPSLTKIELQFHENSQFEIHCKDYNKLENTLNKILSYDGHIVTIHITPRMTVYPPFSMCLLNIDPYIRSKIRIMTILDNSIRVYYNNQFWLWFANTLKKAQYNIQNINIIEYYHEITGSTDMDKAKFQLNLNKDITPNTSPQTIKNWVDSIIILPKNPLIKHRPPTFINTTKIDKLLKEMIPDKFITNVNRSYSATVNKINPPDPADNPPLTVTMKINPTLINGGGPNNKPQPHFLISGKLHKFYHYKPDLVQQYIMENYPQCGKCFRPGYTTANCNPCKHEIITLKNKKKQELKGKNLNSRQLRAELSKVKAPARCRNCSGKHLYINCNTETPKCYLDCLKHRVGDRMKCELWRSIANILAITIKLKEMNINPQKLSPFKLADFMLTDKKSISTDIPKSLQIQIPQNIVNIQLENNDNQNNPKVQSNNQPNPKQNVQTISHPNINPSPQPMSHPIIQNEHRPNQQITRQRTSKSDLQKLHQVNQQMLQPMINKINPSKNKQNKNPKVIHINNNTPKPKITKCNHPQIPMLIKNNNNNHNKNKKQPKSFEDIIYNFSDSPELNENSNYLPPIPSGHVPYPQTTNNKDTDEDEDMMERERKGRKNRDKQNNLNKRSRSRSRSKKKNKPKPTDPKDRSRQNTPINKP